MKKNTLLYAGLLIFGLVGAFVFPAYKLQLSFLYILIVLAMTWDVQEFEAGQFDLVVALHVIEHVRNLNETIGEIARILREGGHTFIVCPCVAHIKARIAGANWKYLGPPGHLWYFSPKTLSLLMEKHGFAVEIASNFYHRAHVRILAKKQ